MQRPDIGLLALGFLRVIWKRLDERSEIPDPIDPAIRKDALDQNCEIQPTICGAHYAPIVKVESIDIDVGLHKPCQ